MPSKPRPSHNFRQTQSLQISTVCFSTRPCYCSLQGRQGRLADERASLEAVNKSGTVTRNASHEINLHLSQDHHIGALSTWDAGRWRCR
jgi:hypothetical protein